MNENKIDIVKKSCKNILNPEMKHKDTEFDYVIDK